MIPGVIATKAKVRQTKPPRKDRFWTFAEMEVELPESNQPTELWDGEWISEQHGAREFWLIDPEAKTVEVCFLENEQYRLLGRFRSGQAAASRLLPGFKVAVDDLFAGTEP